MWAQVCRITIWFTNKNSQESDNQNGYLTYHNSSLLSSYVCTVIRLFDSCLCIFFCLIFLCIEFVSAYLEQFYRFSFEIRLRPYWIARCVLCVLYSVFCARVCNWRPRTHVDDANVCALLPLLLLCHVIAVWSVSGLMKSYFGVRPLRIKRPPTATVCAAERKRERRGRVHKPSRG